MRISLTFNVSVLLIAVLTLSTPVSFSQQNSSIIEAKLTAERDARSDIGKMMWFGGGFLLTGGTILVFRIAVDEDSSGNLTVGLIGASCLLHGAGLAGAFLSNPAPLPSRLVGKSAEYVNFYTDAYQTEAGRSRALWGAAGSLSGCLVGYGIILLEAALTEDVGF